MFDFIKENPILCLIAFLLVVSPSFLFGAVQIIAVIILAIIIFAVIGLLSLKWKINKLQKTAQNNASNQSQRQQQFNRSNDPDVNVYSTGQEKKVADDVGDYVEFEEIKEEK
ncbi:MAG: DUF4834 family protein [Rikenellaceae bacterium]